MPCKCLQRIHHGDWAICHISCIIPIRTGTVASWKGQDRAVCIMSVEILEARVVSWKSWWYILMIHFHCKRKKLCRMEQLYSMGQTLTCDLTVCCLLLLQMNFAPLHLICFFLLNCLADFQRKAATSSEVTGKHCKVVISFCMLVNARSQWVMDRVTALLANR